MEIAFGIPTGPISRERGRGHRQCSQHKQYIFHGRGAAASVISQWEMNPTDVWYKHFQDVSGLHFLMVMLSLMDAWSKASWYWKHSIFCCVRMWEILQSASRVFVLFIYFYILSHFKGGFHWWGTHGEMKLVLCHSVTLAFEKGSSRASRVLLFIYLFIHQFCVLL